MGSARALLSAERGFQASLRSIPDQGRSTVYDFAVEEWSGALIVVAPSRPGTDRPWKQRHG
jgi:hypothetical protein